ncbi:MAG: AMP-binding protein [Flavobacteriales bacterium]|nr:AMP-binding protein [Flavobacteriales bacterium]
MSDPLPSFAALSFERFQAYVEDLRSRSPWYRERLATVGSLRTADDFTRLPFTTKQELSEHHGRFLSVTRSDIAEHVFTSGTTGRPVPFALSATDVDRLGANERQSLAMAGITAADTVQITTTLDKRFMAGLAYWLGLRAIGAGVVRSGPGNAEGQWETAKECGTTTLIGVPSFLLRMLREWEKRGLRVDQTSITRAVCIGEPIASGFGAPNLLAQRIMELCGWSLNGTYASTEMATACTEARPFAGHVVPSDLMHIEVVDDEGRPVPEGEAGEVVATPFGVEAMPLLRFRTGDVCAWRWGIDAKGHPAKLLGPVLGRKEQRLKVKGTTLWPQQIIDALNAEEGLEGFAIIRERDEHGGDALRVLAAAPAPVLHDLGDRLADRLRVRPVVEAISRFELDKLIHDPRQRKPMIVIDRTAQV